MSRESPQIREEIVYRRGNILLFGGFPGETVAEEWKCPGKRHKSRTNGRRRNEMSRKAPQNREKLQPRSNKKAPGAIPEA